MPLIQYEQREGPSWCGSSNAPSSGSHIDPFLCEAAMKTAHRLSVGHHKRQRSTSEKQTEKEMGCFILLQAAKAEQHLMATRMAC